MLVFTTVPSASAQQSETTGGLQGYVKDKSGGAIVKAEVELTSPALLGKKTAETDGAGFFHFALLPPGEYTTTITMQSFRTYKRTGIRLEVGKLPTLEIVMEVGAVSEVIEVKADTVVVDTTTSKVAVTITQDVIQNIPKGRSYQSLITMAPGARQEPLQSRRDDRGRASGFQIDGASDSENTYLVEGLDTGEVRSGGIKSNIIFEFVQEVQVKSSGFEAEYGGAVGGVVSVIQKRGSNEWHGNLVTYFRSNSLDANDQCAITPSPNPSSPTLFGQQLACGLRANPSTSLNSLARTDAAAENYKQKQDQYRILEPGFDVGGPLLKDRLWLFASYIPSLQSVSRTVNFTGLNPGVRTFTQTFNTHNAMGRLDYQAYSKLHVYGSWVYGYSRVRGQLPGIADSTIAGQINTQASTNPLTIRADTGSVNPSNIFNVGGDWTPTSRTVISARYGYFFYNSQDRGKPTGLRYIYQADLNATSRGLDGLPVSSSFFNTSGFSNISSNFQNIFDAFSRRAFSTDFSQVVSKWGTHAFKFGYGFNRLSENVLSGFNTAQVLVFWTQLYGPGTAAGNTACSSIIAANVASFGAGAAAGGCQGKVGHFIVRDGVDTVGNVSSLNHGIYIQDAWTVGHGLTLNLGVRFDKEFLPPFSAGASSISFGFGSKVSPRIGGAYDLLHNGKVKIFASYGKFFDIMKYSLPRGSFGGEYWHDCVYAMDDPNFNLITPSSPGGHGCPVTGPAPGVTVGRFIENQDFRANVKSTIDPGVDPNIKPMQQHEFVVGADWAWTPKTGIYFRYVRKRLDRTIEDLAVVEDYYIGNPGPNTYSDLLHRALPSNGISSPLCSTCPRQPKAIRNYDGLEVRVQHRGTNLFGQISYTYSRLRGNYAGLTNSDITDGNGGRHNPNNHRDFDHPDMQFTTSGAVQNGPLATDRPHVLGMVGWYRLKWLGMETTFGATQLIASGSPNSTCWATVNSASSCQFFEQRGTFVQITRAANGAFVKGAVDSGARMPVLTQSDFNFHHSLKVSKSNEALRLAFEATFLNLFNQGTVLSVFPSPLAASFLKPTSTDPYGVNYSILLGGYDPFAAANATAPGFTTNTPLTVSNRYGLPFLFQTRRTIRLAVRFSF